MTKHPASISSLFAAFLLTACTTDDPKSGGFFGGLFGLGSGAYEERVVEEKAALQAEKVRYRKEADGNERLDQTLEKRRAEASGLERQVASLEEEMNGLDAEIAALQREETVTREDVEKAEADVASLLDDIDRIETEQNVTDQARALGADANPDTDPAAFGEPPSERVSDLRAYIDKLQEAVDALKSARAKRAGEAMPVDGGS